MGCLCFRKLSKIKPFTYAFGRNRWEAQEPASSTTTTTIPADSGKKEATIKIKGCKSRGESGKVCQSIDTMGNTSSCCNSKDRSHSQQHKSNDNEVHSSQVSWLDGHELIVSIMIGCLFKYIDTCIYNENKECQWMYSGLTKRLFDDE